MQGGLLLDVVIGWRVTMLHLFAYECQPLLVGQEAFLVFDLGLHILCGDTGLRRHQGDGLTDEGLHKYLHSGF